MPRHRQKHYPTFFTVNVVKSAEVCTTLLGEMPHLSRGIDLASAHLQTNGSFPPCLHGK